MSKNDITGDSIRSKLPSKSFDENFDIIFGKKKIIKDKVLDTPQGFEVKSGVSKQDGDQYDHSKF